MLLFVLEHLLVILPFTHRRGFVDCEIINCVVSLARTAQDEEVATSVAFVTRASNASSSSIHYATR